MKRNEEKSTLVWLGLAVYICFESIRLPIGSWRDPGAGFFPLLSGVSLGILSTLTFLEGFLEKNKEGETAGFSGARWKRLIFVFVVLLGYSLVLEELGFIISTFLLLVLLFRGIEPQKWMVSIGGSAAASVLCYAIFQLWLKTQLPRGPLGF